MYPVTGRCPQTGDHLLANEAFQENAVFRETGKWIVIKQISNQKRRTRLKKKLPQKTRWKTAKKGKLMKQSCPFNFQKRLQPRLILFQLDGKTFQALRLTLDTGHQLTLTQTRFTQ